MDSKKQFLWAEVLRLTMQLSLYVVVVVAAAAAVVAIVCLALQVLSMQLLPQHQPALPAPSRDSHDSFNLDF